MVNLKFFFEFTVFEKFCLKYWRSIYRSLGTRMRKICVSRAGHIACQSRFTRFINYIQQRSHAIIKDCFLKQ